MPRSEAERTGASSQKDILGIPDIFGISSLQSESVPDDRPARDPEDAQFVDPDRWLLLASAFVTKAGGFCVPWGPVPSSFTKRWRTGRLCARDRLFTPDAAWTND